MSARTERMLNMVTGHFLTALYIALPTSCAVGAAYDIWHRGLASLPLQVGLGIAGVFVALRLIVYALIIADAVGDAAGKGTLRAKATLASWRMRLGDAMGAQVGRKLSHA